MFTRRTWLWSAAAVLPLLAGGDWRGSPAAADAGAAPVVSAAECPCCPDCPWCPDCCPVEASCSSAPATCAPGCVAAKAAEHAGKVSRAAGARDCPPCPFCP
jgi:hypothetical protein